MTENVTAPEAPMFKRGRSEFNKIPKRVEALMLLLTDNGMGAITALNMVDLDNNPATEKLPLKEKKLILQYWPTWYEYCDNVQAYKEQRAVVMRAVKNTDNAVGKLKNKLKLREMQMSDQLRAASQVFCDATMEAALRFAKTDPEDAIKDPAAFAIYKQRNQHLKDTIVFARQLHDLSTRLEHAEGTVTKSYALNEETQALLDKARSVIPEAWSEASDGSA